MSAMASEGYSAALVMCIQECLGGGIYTGGGVMVSGGLLDCSIVWSSAARCSAR